MLSAQQVISVVLLGIGATLVMDFWSVILKKLRIPTLDYAMVGRWAGYCLKGKFAHRPIAASAPLAGEKPLGWAIHYATGIAFAFLPVGMGGADWLDAPTLLPAVAAGVGTVVFPWFMMQPAMGAGIMASRMPNPAKSRILSLAAHAVYGLGLYLAALLRKALWL